MLKFSIYYLNFKLRYLPVIYSLSFVLKFLIYNCIIPFWDSCFMWIIPPLNFSLRFLVCNLNYILKLPFYNFNFELKILRVILQFKFCINISNLQLLYCFTFCNFYFVCTTSLIKVFLLSSIFSPLYCFFPLTIITT